MADGGGRNLLIDPPEPPRNVEAEQALLGAIMVNNAVMDRDVVALLEPEHFSYALHRQVFHVMRGLRAKGMLVEPTTLAEYFRDEKLLADAGGPVYLARMMAAASTIINSHQYAVVVRDMAVRRRLVEAAQAVMELAQHPTADATIEEIVAASEASLAAVSSGLTMSRTMVHVSKALDGAISQAEAAYKANGRIVGAPTGLEDLDRKLGGLHRANLIVLAGRPAMGKTAMAAGFARAAASAGRSVAFFSLEMSVDELGLRMIAEDTGVSVERVRAARIGADDIQDMMVVRDRLSGLPMHIDDDGGASIAYIRLRCRQLHRVKPLGLIVVDYLQLIAARSRGDGNRVNEVSEITRALKMMAKEFDCPVLALSQLSRRCEEREDKRPQLSDLRESGSIEQDANVVLFVYREEVYTAREKPKETERDSAEAHADKMRRWNDRMARDAGLAECIIAKNRNGATGTVRLHFDGPRTRFGNLARGGE